MVKRTLSNLCQHVGGQAYPPLSKSVIKLHIQLKKILTMDIANADANKELHVNNIAGCMVFCLNDPKSKYIAKCKSTSTVTVIICRQPQKFSMIPLLNNVNLWWDNRFLINCTSNNNRSNDPPNLYVRHMQFSDFSLIKLSMNHSSLSEAHFRCRFGLPVIVNTNRQIISIPHFNYEDTSHFQSQNTKIYIQPYLKHTLQ